MRAAYRQNLFVLALLPTAVGLLVSALAQGFVWLIVWLNDALLISPASREAAGGGMLLAATLIVPTVGGLIVGLVRYFFREPDVHGPAEIIATVQTRQQRLSVKRGLLGALNSLVSLGSGATVGEYGPLVHIGGSSGAKLAQAFNSDATTVNIAIACGVASAISTVFNAPIAGILFAHEVILRHFAPRAFAPVALASIIGFIIANAPGAREPMLATASVSLPQAWEFGLFIVLGMIGAAIALTYMHAILKADQWGQRLPIPGFTKPALAGLALGIIALQIPEVLGMGFEILQSTLAGESFAVLALLAILLARLATTAMCLGMGFAGGVFGPALVIGSVFGALCGIALETGLGLTLTSTAIYAVCGMVAVTAPVIGAPVTAIVIVMELTGSYTMTLAALASVAVSNFIVSRAFGRSLFDRQLQLCHLDLSAGRSKAILAMRTVKPLVSQEFVKLDHHATAAEARDTLIDSDRSDLFLVDAKDDYQGSLHLKDVLQAKPDQKVIELRNRNDIVMLEDLSIWRAMHRLRKFSGESVAVIDAQGKLSGALFAADLISSYLEIQADLRAEEQISVS